MRNIRVLGKREACCTTLGIIGGVGTISWITYTLGFPLLIASYGASVVLLYGAQSSPLAQPRNLIGGHLIGGLIGVSCYQLMGETWYSLTIAVTLAILLMMMTDTVHPPGGATALVAVLGHGGISFIPPLMAGVFILLISALLANRMSPLSIYPVRRTT